MECLAENQFILHKKLFIEGMLRISKSSYGRFARRSMAILLGLWCVFLVFTILIHGDLAHCLLLLVFLALIGWWLCRYMPRHNAGRAYRTLVNRCGADPRRVTRFYEDHMEIGESEPTEIPYENICNLYHSKHLLILLCENNQGVLLSRDGFTLGNEEIISALLSGAKDKECASHD